MSRRRATRAGARSPTAGAHAAGPSPAPQPHRLRTACTVAAACFAVYLTSLRCPPAWDTIPARLLPFSILDLNEFEWLQRGGVPYFLRRTSDGRIMSKYPVAAPVLAVPLALPAVWWLQRHQVSDDDVRFRVITVVVERLAAASIAALSVGLVFLALCTRTASSTAIGMALAYGLGSSTWSTSSQALWQHGLAELSLAGLSMFLLGEDTRARAALAGVFAALGVVARPTMAIFALLAAVFIWRERPRRRAAFLVLPIAGAAAVAAYNLRAIGSVLGGYAGVTFGVPSMTRLLGLLISPNRGLFIFTPTAALALPGFLRRPRQRAAWVPYLGAGCLAYLLLYAAFGGWWGGHTYGPRFLIDVLPAIVLCAVPAVEWLRATRLGRGMLLALAAWSVAVQGVGAYCDADGWNQVPVSVDHRPERVWDWSDPQILRALRGGWHGTDLGPLLWQTLTDPRPALLRPLGRAALVGELAVEDPLPLRLRAGGVARLALRITNRGSAVWPAFADFGHLDCRVIAVWTSGGKSIDDGSYGLPLPRNLGPGESARIAAVIEAPKFPGTYALALSLVQLIDSASGHYGGAHLEVPVQVE